LALAEVLLALGFFGSAAFYARLSPTR